RVKSQQARAADTLISGCCGDRRCGRGSVDVWMAGAHEVDVVGKVGRGGEHGQPPCGELVLPCVECFVQGAGSADGTAFCGDGGDVVEQVAASPKEMREFCVANVVGAIDAVASGRVAVWCENAGVFPVAQGGRGEVEATGEVADAVVAR